MGGFPSSVSMLRKCLEDTSAREEQAKSKLEELVSKVPKDTIEKVPEIMNENSELREHLGREEAKLANLRTELKDELTSAHEAHAALRNTLEVGEADAEVYVLATDAEYASVCTAKMELDEEHQQALADYDVECDAYHQALAEHADECEAHRKVLNRQRRLESRIHSEECALQQALEKKSLEEHALRQERHQKHSEEHALMQTQKQKNLEEQALMQARQQTHSEEHALQQARQAEAFQKQMHEEHCSARQRLEALKKEDDERLKSLQAQVERTEAERTSLEEELLAERRKCCRTM